MRLFTETKDLLSARRSFVVSPSRKTSLDDNKGLVFRGNLEEILINKLHSIMRHNYYVYILTNTSRTLYTGVTNNLERRLYEHRNKLADGFTKKYNISQLVYFETTSDITAAIAREKQIKDKSRAKGSH